MRLSARGTYQVGIHANTAVSNWEKYRNKYEYLPTRPHHICINVDEYQHKCRSIPRYHTRRGGAHPGSHRQSATASEARGALECTGHAAQSSITVPLREDRNVSTWKPHSRLQKDVFKVRGVVTCYLLTRQLNGENSVPPTKRRTPDVFSRSAQGTPRSLPQPCRCARLETCPSGNHRTDHKGFCSL